MNALEPSYELWAVTEPVGRPYASSSHSRVSRRVWLQEEWEFMCLAVLGDACDELFMGGGARGFRMVVDEQLDAIGAEPRHLLDGPPSNSLGVRFPDDPP
jgi:hypothetical protein